MTKGPNARALTLAVACLLACAPFAAAQPGVSSALGGPPQPKLSAPPPTAAVKPGEGPESPQRAALLAAIAANDVAGIIANGGTAAMAGTAQYLRIRARDARAMDPAETEFVTNQFAVARYALLDGRLAVAYGVGRSGNGIAGVYGFPNLTLPGGNEGLPDVASLEGDVPVALLQLAAPLPPGPARTLPEIPTEWLTAGK